MVQHFKFGLETNSVIPQRASQAVPCALAWRLLVPARALTADRQRLGRRGPPAAGLTCSPVSTLLLSELVDPQRSLVFGASVKLQRWKKKKKVTVIWIKPWL